MTRLAACAALLGFACSQANTGTTAGGPERDAAADRDGATDSGTDAAHDAGADATPDAGTEPHRCWGPDVEPQPIAANQRFVASIAVHGGDVYWVNWGDISSFGGTPSVSSTQLVRRRGATLETASFEDNCVRLFLRDEALWLVSTSAMGVLADLAWQRFLEQYMASDFSFQGSRLYWGSGNWQSFTKRPGEPEQLIEHEGEPCRFASDATGTTVLTNDNVTSNVDTWQYYRIPPGEHTATKVASWPGGPVGCSWCSNPGTALTDSHVVTLAGLDEQSAVVAIRRSDGEMTTLQASPGNVRSIARSERYVYWAREHYEEQTNRFAIFRVPLDALDDPPGAPEPVVECDHAPAALFIGDGQLYWSTAVTYPKPYPDHGTVWRADLPE